MKSAARTRLIRLREADTPKVAIRSHGVTPDVLEELKNPRDEVLDLTCPFVARIHELVRNYSSEYGAPVIVGKRTHPEVIGTCGWCRQSYVVADETEAPRCRKCKGRFWSRRLPAKASVSSA